MYDTCKHIIPISATDNQDAFDKMVAHLAAMPHRSARHGACQYRTADGNRCAVGALIADEHYNELFENATVDALARGHERWGTEQEQHIFTLDAGDVDIELLVRMQAVHDDPSSWATVGNGYDENGYPIEHNGPFIAWYSVRIAAKLFGLSAANIPKGE